MIDNKLKKDVAWAAIKQIEFGSIIGVGTGSTVSCFIDALSSIKNKIEGAVSSSYQSSLHLRKIGIPIFDLNNIDILPIYIDSADEINKNMQMIKGGGAALTHEKIIASMADKFICIVDKSKQVDILGKFPLPVEIIPMARAYVARQLVKLGGLPKYRNNVITEEGNIIIDVYNLNIIKPTELEQKINNIPGVVTVGLFAIRKADLVLISNEHGIETIQKK